MSLCHFLYFYQQFLTLPSLDILVTMHIRIHNASFPINLKTVKLRPVFHLLISDSFPSIGQHVFSAN